MNPAVINNHYIYMENKFCNTNFNATMGQNSIFTTKNLVLDIYEYLFKRRCFWNFSQKKNGKNFLNKLVSTKF